MLLSACCSVSFSNELRFEGMLTVAPFCHKKQGGFTVVLLWGLVRPPPAAK